MKLILSCEHGGNKVPTDYRKKFANRHWLLQTHRGWDPGALAVAKDLSQSLRTPLVYSQTTRLLVDLNRELGDESLFSVVTENLDSPSKARILKRHFWPYYRKLRALVVQKMKATGVFHLSIHSFTPVRKGVRRATDIGLLFHKNDQVGKEFCIRLREQLEILKPNWQVDFNKPYTADGTGIMLALRKDFGLEFGPKYSGVYIEVNQKFLKVDSSAKAVAKILSAAISKT